MRPFIPWMRGKPLAWGITVADTYAISYIDDTVTRAAATDRAASNKTAKYTEISKTHHFIPIAIETGGSWNDLAIEFINKLGKRITAATDAIPISENVSSTTERKCGCVSEHFSSRALIFRHGAFMSTSSELICYLGVYTSVASALPAVQMFCWARW